MSEERRRILAMLAEGTITVDDAERLLAAVGEPAAEGAPGEDAAQTSRRKPKYLRVVVNGGEKGDKVNIRVPYALLRAGLKLSALLPDDAREKVGAHLRGKGIDLDLRDVKPEDLDELLDSLAELSVDVNDEKEKVRIYTE